MERYLSLLSADQDPCTSERQFFPQPEGFNWYDKTAYLLGWWTATGHFNIELPLKDESALLSRYKRLTGALLTDLPDSPRRYKVTGYETAAGRSNRFAPKFEFFFKELDRRSVPDDLFKDRNELQHSRPNCISSKHLFWNLIKIGFRVTSNSQDRMLILESIPPNLRGDFDCGFQEGLAKSRKKR